MESAFPRGVRPHVLLLVASSLWFALQAPAGAAAAPSAVDPGFTITVWRNKDGLPAGHVRALLQDAKGFLWIATFNGVGRFDGVRFRHYHVANTPSLSNNLVNALFEDRSGRIWLGHDTGDITVWENGAFRAIATDASWQGSPIDQFAEDRQGTVWVRNRLGWLLSVQTLAPGAVLHTAHGQRVSDMISDDAGKIWFIGATGVFLLDAAAPETRTAPQIPLRENTRRQLCPARAGGFWVIGASTARRWANGGWTGEIRATPVNARLVFNRWIETREGSLAIGTFDDGLHIFPLQGPHLHLDTAQGLPASYVKALVEDREGNLWAGAGDDGLCRIRPSNVAMVGPPGGWRERAVQTVVATRDGSVWAGTEGAGIFRLHNGEWTQLDRRAGLTSPGVKSLFEDRTGQLWIGLASGGFGRMVQGRFQPEFNHSDLQVGAAVFQATDGRMWFGGLRGAAFLEGSSPKFVSSAREPLTHVRGFAETPDGAVWMASLGRGLGCYRDGALKVFHRADGLPSDYLWSLHASADGTLWIGTYDRGLARYRDGRFSLIGTAQGLPGNMIGQILEDDYGALWLGTNGGIARVSRDELDRCAEGVMRRISAESFDLTDGLSTLGLAGGAQNTACRAPDGTLWFATEKGLAHLDPRAARPVHLPPPVAIEAYRIDGAETLIAGPAAPVMMTVPPGSRRLEIDYTGLSLSAPHRIRFRYRLDGVDADWTEAETRRTAYFSYLRPGHYTFRVQAVPDNDTHTAPDATLRLHVVPFFWETTWFAVLASLLALFVVVVAVYTVLRIRHRRRLEELARAQAIERDRTRIAHDLHDKIGSGLTELSFLSHSALAATREPERVASHIREIQGATTEMTEAIDEIVWAVNPSHDSLESLLSYLGRSVQEFAQHTGLQCHIDVPIDREHVGVTAEVRHELYLALREALHNVVKHAGATAVWFALRRTGTELCFILEDNGRGLPDRPADDAASRSGVGLESMQQRMARLGGNVTWSSRTGGGTVITFQIRGPATSVTSPEVVT